MQNANINFDTSLGDLKKMFDGDKSSDIKLAQNVNYYIELKTEKDFTARSLIVYPSHNNINAVVELQAKKTEVIEPYLTLLLTGII